jgi:quercetin dioxygenase-like cupin family protein
VKKKTERGPAHWFSGTVWLDEVASTISPSALRVHGVTFEPCARTAWHEHPLGQVLYATQGLGLVCIGADAVRVMRAGDAVTVPPSVRHWHGSFPGHLFVHIAIQEAASDGSTATWYEHVADADYEAAAPEMAETTGEVKRSVLH